MQHIQHYLKTSLQPTCKWVQQLNQIYQMINNTNSAPRPNWQQQNQNQNQTQNNNGGGSGRAGPAISCSKWRWQDSSTSSLCRIILHNGNGSNNLTQWKRTGAICAFIVLPGTDRQREVAGLWVHWPIHTRDTVAVVQGIRLYDVRHGGKEKYKWEW